MLTRRGFLIGAEAMVTGAFVKKATAFSRTAGEPLILPIAKRPAETLYIYEQDCEGWRDFEYGEAPYYRCGKWRVRSARTSPSHRRLQPGASTCAASGIALTPTRMFNAS